MCFGYICTLNKIIGNVIESFLLSFLFEQCCIVQNILRMMNIHNNFSRKGKGLLSILTEITG
jgi:hypothetical protein